MAENTYSDINPFGLLKGNSSKSTKESSVPPRTNNDHPTEDRNHPSNMEQKVTEPTPSSRKVILFNPREVYYDMSGEKFMVIFNHRTFKKTRFYEYDPPSERTGTDEDVRRLKEVFGKLKFKIFVHNDKTYDELWTILCEMHKQDYSTASCLSIVILTHGEGDGLLCAADRRYYFSDVLKKFESHPTLAAKPKLFFIQACRGRKVDIGVSLTTDGPKKGNKFVVPSHADFLIMRSSVDDYRGYRDSDGSWLIQELCNVVEHYCDDLDLLQMITLVHNKACRGEMVDIGVSLRFDGPKNGNKFVVPAHADFLIMRSSVDDFRSYRDFRGSWMIQELCNVVEHYSKDLDLLQMITLVHNKVAFKYTTSTDSAETNDKVAMPETIFRLTRFLKFDV